MTLPFDIEARPGGEYYIAYRDGGGHMADLPCRCLIAENRALAERADALHKALRERAIGYFAFGYRGHEQEECCLCGRSWKSSEPERHAEGCLATPSAPKGPQQTTTGKGTE